jgi:hypothetical protein
MADLERLAKAAKDISYFPGWSKPEVDTSYTWFDAPLEIDGVTETGLVLHGGCFANRPDCHVTFELRVSRASTGNKCFPLSRVDWRALTGHSNPRFRGHRLSGARLGDTHIHAFELNWDSVQHRMLRPGLRFAQDIGPPPNDFEELLQFAGNSLRINNIGVVSRPPWVYDLFQIGG